MPPYAVPGARGLLFHHTRPAGADRTMSEELDRLSTFFVSGVAATGKEAQPDDASSDDDDDVTITIDELTVDELKALLQEAFADALAEANKLAESMRITSATGTRGARASDAPTTKEAKGLTTTYKNRRAGGVTFKG